MFFSAWTVAGSTADAAGAAVCAEAPGAPETSASASRQGLRIESSYCFSRDWVA